MINTLHAPTRRRTCPDCAEPAIDGNLAHRATCPVGLDVGRARNGDRRWFRRNRGVRVRSLSWGEAVELGLAQGADLGDASEYELCVAEIRPGVRRKSLFKIESPG
jgi:hypothetical protein